MPFPWLFCKTLLNKYGVIKISEDYRESSCCRCPLLELREPLNVGLYYLVALHINQPSVKVFQICRELAYLEKGRYISYTACLWKRCPSRPSFNALNMLYMAFCGKEIRIRYIKLLHYNTIQELIQRSLVRQNTNSFS